LPKQNSSYYSYSGYIGALVLIFGVLLSFTVEHSFGRNGLLFLIALATFIFMVVYELTHKSIFDRSIGVEHKKDDRNLYLLKSSLIRFLALFFIFFLIYSLVQNHYYFKSNYFTITREFFTAMLYLYLIGGVPYIFLTLKFRGGDRWEFNDYSILLLISYRTVIKGLFFKKGFKRLKNRRIWKVYLVYLVNLFFLTLMVKFFLSEYNATLSAYTRLTSESFEHLTFFKQYHTTYLFFYHFLFIIDVGIAVIGYSVASRWLDNRTKSVDMTMGGWFVALMCYPPMNSGFSDKFIGYGHISTHNIIYAEWAYMILMALILTLFTIYVWATVALGFKFSNLTNRGIVDRGPYAYIRHPAYATKNLAWWLDNTFVLSNFWASVALFIWNGVYILRALTEERHLKKDPAYIEYMKKVKYRFIPKVI